MAATTTSSRRGARPAAGLAASTKSVQSWQDDPNSGLPTIARPGPKLSKAPLRFKIKGTAVPPGAYQPNTPQFRYWTAAEALRRGGDFWAARGISQWEVGPVLPVGLDEGVDLNAYYNRVELAFFHEAIGGKTIFSGESPDVVCHEMGHAILDSHRPQLWDAPFIEVGSFHESFGDMSAILCQLQLQTVRAAALSGVKSYKASRLSRLAEQLGWAIRQAAPQAVDPDCLRNAYNSFQYIDPQTLPDSAPANQLCAEVHSFSRIFTGAFYEILSGMLKIRSSSPKDTDLSAVAVDAALLLIDATAAAPVQPDYFAQVASHIIDADTARFSGKYRSTLVNTFVKRKILPASAVQALQAAPDAKSAIRSEIGIPMLTDRPAKPEIHRVEIPAREFGLEDRALIVEAPIERKPFRLVAAALMHRETEPASVEQAAHRFVKMLFAHDRVDAESRKRRISPQSPRQQLRRTHVLLESPQGLKLQRRLFHCGCGCGR